MYFLDEVFSMPTEDVKTIEKKNSRPKPEYNIENVPYMPLILSSNFGSFPFDIESGCLERIKRNILKMKSPVIEKAVEIFECLQASYNVLNIQPQVFQWAYNCERALRSLQRMFPETVEQYSGPLMYLFGERIESYKDLSKEDNPGLHRRSLLMYHLTKKSISVVCAPRRSGKTQASKNSNAVELLTETRANHELLLIAQNFDIIQTHIPPIAQIAGALLKTDLFQNSGVILKEQRDNITVTRANSIHGPNVPSKAKLTAVASGPNVSILLYFL